MINRTSASSPGDIITRLASLTENAKALAQGKPPTKPIQGTDEIAELDRLFREMANALQEATRKERAIFENALDIICSLDAEGKFVTMSPSSFKILGYRPEELIGRRYTEFLVSDEVKKSEQAEQEVIEGKLLINFENRYRHKDGAKVDLLWSAWWSDPDKVMFAMARDMNATRPKQPCVNQKSDTAFYSKAIRIRFGSMILIT